MNPTDVKGLGQIVEANNVPYDEGRKIVKGLGGDFSKMTARNTAYARTILGKGHEFSTNGNWIVEEVIYNLEGIKNPVLLMVPGPVYHNPETATGMHKQGVEFLLNERGVAMPKELKQYGKNWTDAITALVKQDVSPLEALAFELPSHQNFGIPVEELLGLETDKLSDPAYFKKLSKEAQVAAVLWKDQTKLYAEFLKNAGILEVPFYLISKDNAQSEKSEFSRALWFSGLDVRSDLDGDYILVYDLSVRGVREGGQNLSEVLSELGVSSEQELRDAVALYRQAQKIIK